jgi:fermentation-respiration switch protein FrsA (DUF1100 family)
MAKTSAFSGDYVALDVPEVLARIFYPRPEPAFLAAPVEALDLKIPVASGVALGARLHQAGQAAPTLLFFHGNGEIVADYDDLGVYYRNLGINFFPVDYRGYGRSTGVPTVTGMLRDSHAVLEFVRDRLKAAGHTGPLVVMGRSLGSAPALELASRRPEEIDGLIIESGFAYVGPLLQVLGVDLEKINFQESAGFRNLDKIAGFPKPTLIIHAEHDQIIPLSDGQALFAACPATAKTLLVIPAAGHNDLMLAGFHPYMAAIQKLLQLVA